jgi:hypothetical protein
VAGILGIDAAWTEKEPSGMALLESSQVGWRCVAVTPSYGSFLALAEGTPVDWDAKTKGAYRTSVGSWRPRERSSHGDG